MSELKDKIAVELAYCRHVDLGVSETASRIEALVTRKHIYDAAAAVIRTYGDQRYQAAIDDVVAWLASELPYDVVSGMVARRFGRDA